MAQLKKGLNNVRATASGNLDKLGLTPGNCTVVYQVDKNYKSWVPGRGINAITKYTAGYNYLITVTEDLDLKRFENA